MGKFPQEWKDAGYLEFLASELDKQPAYINGLLLEVVSRSLRQIAERVRNCEYENLEER